MPETWEPDGGENAVIIQPGGIWVGPHTRLVRGRLCTAEHRYITAGSALSEFDVGLRFGEEPAEGAWDDVDPDDEAAWNNYFDALVEDKIGGMPVPTIISGPILDRFPHNWRLLLQLNTKDEPFFLRFASDGVGYTVLSGDRRAGKFMWSR
jgi:hypothetical protein